MSKKLPIIPVDKEDKENKRFYNKIIRSLREAYNIISPADVIQLNLLANDLLRLKICYDKIKKITQFQIKFNEKIGKYTVDVNNIVYYMNQLESQIRATMRELRLTRRTKKETDKDIDFASFMAEVIDVKPRETKKKIRKTIKRKN